MYLALEEVYLPLSAPVSKYTPLRVQAKASSDTTDGTLTLFGGPLATTSASDEVRRALFRLQFGVRSTQITNLGFSRFRRPY